ncbi:hypothetical protein CV102_17215 [Natronococcus pandeyae]|uniref:ABC transporter substrate-binding protein n=1 Tax=Natronococcus pandeyae TaxID=2055836 RepID=A0A8J8PYT5_9EURY|nr:extracellular solute-binding protein [Natronococcus pandeyae]TYL37361.1 hypothetical protein CV102_17215 [Natronococcus pandeyae]
MAPSHTKHNQFVSRRQTLIGASGIGITTLAGCLGGDTDDSVAGSTGSAGDVELEFWHIFGSELGGHLEEIVEEYNEKDNGVHVNLTSQGSYGDNFQATMSSLNAGNAPHITLLATDANIAAMESGQFVPVSDLLEDRIDFDDRFMEPVLDYFSVPNDDRYFSLPVNNSTAIMSYNKDMFAEAGLDPEDPPQSFGEVRQVSEALVDDTQAEEGCAWANVGWFPAQWHGWAEAFQYNEQNGRGNPEHGPTEINLHEGTAKRIYGWWKEMYDDGLYMATQQGWGDASGAALQSWRVGITLGSTAGLGRTAQLAEEAEQPFELGAAPLFSPHDDRHGCRIGGGSLWVPEMAVDSSEEREAVVDFFDWITGPEPQAEWHKRTGYFPINVGSREILEEEGWFDENPAWTAGFESLEESETSEYTRLSILPDGPEINPEIMDIWTELRQGEDLDDTLETYKGRIDDILQDGHPDA